jgi:hypothetical protein
MSASIDRVVVPLDAATENHAALEIAARLAAHAGAPLAGVFIEDEDLLLLARLPFARDVRLTAGAAPLSLAEVEQQLRLMAERARQELAAAAARHRIDWSFEVVRPAAGGPLVMASERDLVVASTLTRPIGRHFRVEWHRWSAIAQVAGSFLLARRGWSEGGSVSALVRDRGAASARLVAAAARLAAAANGALTVLCAPDLADAEGFEAWIAAQLEPGSVRGRIEPMPAAPAALDRRLRELGCRFLALPAGAAENRSDRLRALFDRLACDLLVVR